MRTSCAMMSSRVTSLVEEEGADVDGVEGVGGAADLDRLKHSYALLCFTVVASIAPMTGKWSDTGKGTEK